MPRDLARRGAGDLARAARAAIGAVLLATLPWAHALAGERLHATNVRAADSLASLAPDRDRDRALSEWAKGADLAELLFVLRRPAATLGGSEAPLLEAALARAPGARAALRQRLALRLAAADRARAGSAWRSLAGVTLLPMFARASAHRVAVLLPDSGEYVAEARALRSGLAAGLAPTAARLPVEIMDLATGDDSPDRVAGAFVRAAEVCAVIVGGLQPPSTAALATAARATGLPLIAPGAGGDALGSIGPGVFQVGPSGLQRGRVLARAVLASGARRVGVLSAGESPLVEGFAAEVAVLKAATYAPGTPDLSREIREFKSLGVDLLLWDGEARDAETLLRQLAQEKWSVPICGGAELDPERHHAQIRPLLEGVTFVGEDWQLPASTQSVLDSMARAAGEEHAGPLVARGYLAGRLISEAVTSGALAPEELAAAFGARLVADPDLRGRGFVEWTPAEATLPVFTVTRGRAVALSRGQ